MDANFINPSDTTVKKKTSQNTTIKALEFTGAKIDKTENIASTLGGTALSNKKVKEQIENWKKEKTYKQEIDYNIEKLRTVNGYNSILTNSTNEETLETTWETNDEKYYCAVKATTSNTTYNHNTQQYTTIWITNLYLFELTGPQNLSDAEENLTTGTETVVHSSTAGQLQSSISTWYKTLRMIAIVGLLSVLVYVGIRILISSTGQDKAKYKKMLTDWVAAMCILFLLQYVMVFTMQMTKKVIEIFDTENMVRYEDSNKERPYDYLISTVRAELGETNDSTESFAEIFAYIVIYIVLVIYTMVFLWQYLKRVVMLAFLTMIAPLIALTYPLDKIKDGQAQAFTMWIREYVFNALLPVIHTIIYYMLVSSAIDFIVKGGNWLYAIVAVGFMMPAEKFFRKMFGFDKASSIGQLGAAAGGAMVMNAINKMKSGGGSKSGSGSGGDSSSSSKTRTGYIPAPDSDSGNSGGNPGGGSGGGPGGGSGGNPSRQPNTTSAFGEDIVTGQPKPTIYEDGFKSGSKKIIKGVGNSLHQRYFNKPNAMKLGKKAGRTLRRGIGKGIGIAALGTAGLAAGIASGDPTNVLKYGAAAAAIGASGMGKIDDKAMEFGHENKEQIKENIFGTDEYNMRKTTKELNNDMDFLKTCNQLGLDKEQREEAIRMFSANGITSADDIKNAMDIRARHKDDEEGPVSQEEIVAAAKMHKRLSKSYWGQEKNVEDYERRLKEKGLNPKQAKRAIRLISDFKGDLS